jgi:chromate transporter
VVATLIVTGAPTAAWADRRDPRGAAAGAWLCREAPALAAPNACRCRCRAPRVAALALFALLLIGLPIAAAVSAVPALAVADAFYRAGALVFGGGHVVLPLLHASVVEPGWVSEDAFLSGYGAAQAVPGPLFTFAAYLGAIMTEPPTLAGSALCLVAIFLPMLLVWGAAILVTLGRAALMPASSGRQRGGRRAASPYDPVWTKGSAGATSLAWWPSRCWRSGRRRRGWWCWSARWGRGPLRPPRGSVRRSCWRVPRRAEAVIWRGPRGGWRGGSASSPPCPRRPASRRPRS